MRMFWVYGPDQQQITIIGLVPHPEDKNKTLGNLDNQASQSLSYCGRWDLNPHERNAHKILSLARLPVPTLPLDLRHE